MSNWKEFTKGLIKENPNLVMLLGMCPTLAVTALTALCALVLALVLVIVSMAAKRHALDAGAAVCSLVSAMFLIAGFVTAKGMESGMIEGYCMGTPACSLKSYALVPAVFALAAAIEMGISPQSTIDCSNPVTLSTAAA